MALLLLLLFTTNDVYSLSRNSKKIDMPLKFIHEECELADHTEIANAFNSYCIVLFCIVL